MPYLPVIAGRIVESRAVSDKFLADLRRTVGDLIVEEHYDVFATHAKAYGLGIHLCWRQSRVEPTFVLGILKAG